MAEVSRICTDVCLIGNLHGDQCVQRTVAPNMVWDSSGLRSPSKRKEGGEANQGGRPLDALRSRERLRYGLAGDALQPGGRRLSA